MKLLFLTHEWTARIEDFRTIGRVFIHDTTIAELLDEGFFSLDVGVRNIANFIRMEAVPVIKIITNSGQTILCPRELSRRE
jgi:hypothetical protein